jgi:putative membrane protein
MKIRSLLLGAALASGTAAGSIVLAQEMTPVPAPMPPAATEAQQQTMTEAYANAAAVADMYEIEAANLAWERSKREDVKAFAKMLIADHTATTAGLKVLVDQNKGALPDALDEHHEAMMDQLEAAEEAQFDQMWIAQQITAHEEALKLHEDYAASGDQEPFKTFAADTAKKVKMHLKEAKALGGSAG